MLSRDRHILISAAIKGRDSIGLIKVLRSGMKGEVVGGGGRTWWWLTELAVSLRREETLLGGGGPGCVARGLLVAACLLSPSSLQYACAEMGGLCISKFCPWSVQVSCAAGTGACVVTLLSTMPFTPEPGQSISFLGRKSLSPAARSHLSCPMTTR